MWIEVNHNHLTLCCLCPLRPARSRSSSTTRRSAGECRHFAQLFFMSDSNLFPTELTPCARLQVGVSGPDPHVCSVHPHHEVSSTVGGLLNWGRLSLSLAELPLTPCGCGLVRFNGRAQRYFDRRKKSTMNLANGLTGSTDLEDNVTCDATAVLLKKGSHNVALHFATLARAPAAPLERFLIPMQRGKFT